MNYLPETIFLNFAKESDLEHVTDYASIPNKGWWSKEPASSVTIPYRRMPASKHQQREREPVPTAKAEGLQDISQVIEGMMNLDYFAKGGDTLRLEVSWDRVSGEVSLFYFSCGNESTMKVMTAATKTEKRWNDQWESWETYEHE